MQEDFNNLYALYRVMYDSLVALSDYSIIKNQLKAGENPMATKIEVYREVLALMKPYAEETRPLNFVDVMFLLENVERKAALSKQVEAIGRNEGSKYEAVIKATEWAEVMLRMVVLLHKFNRLPVA